MTSLNYSDKNNAVDKVKCDGDVEISMKRTLQRMASFYYSDKLALLTKLKRDVDIQ